MSWLLYVYSNILMRSILRFGNRNFYCSVSNCCPVFYSDYSKLTKCKTTKLFNDRDVLGKNDTWLAGWYRNSQYGPLLPIKGFIWKISRDAHLALFLRQRALLDCQFYRALDIRVALVGLEVWSDADKCPITQDPFTTLHEFLDWRKVKLLPQKPHDNAQLIRWGAVALPGNQN